MSEFKKLLGKVASQFEEKPKSPEYEGQKHFDGDSTVIDNSRNDNNSTQSKRDFDTREGGNPMVESRFPKSEKGETDIVIEETQKIDSNPEAKDELGETDTVLNPSKLDEPIQIDVIYDAIPEQSGLYNLVDKKKSKK